MGIKSLQDIVSIAFFTALLAVSAFLSLPIGAVPFTLQMLILFLLSLILGSKKACIVVLLYLLLGAIGFPFFAGGKSGLASFLGPTGGFLFSWPIAVLIAGMAKDKGIVLASCFLFIALLFVYLCGAIRTI